MKPEVLIWDAGILKRRNTRLGNKYWTKDHVAVNNYILIYRKWVTNFFIIQLLDNLKIREKYLLYQAVISLLSYDPTPSWEQANCVAFQPIGETIIKIVYFYEPNN